MFIKNLHTMVFFGMLAIVTGNCHNVLAYGLPPRQPSPTNKTNKLSKLSDAELAKAIAGYNNILNTLYIKFGKQDPNAGGQIQVVNTLLTSALNEQQERAEKKTAPSAAATGKAAHPSQMID